jgi:hypothetical protein
MSNSPIKSKINFYLVSLFLLCCDFIAFAQPGDEDDGGGLEDNTDPVPAPIDGRLFVLALLGVLFVYYTYRRHKKIS